MQTHMNDDMQSQWLKSLHDKAKQMVSESKSTIAGGSPGEQSICEWHAGNRMYCRRMPDDEHGVLRISVGGGDDTPVLLNYCTVRGSIGKCIALLEQAIVALRECPE